MLHFIRTMAPGWLAAVMGTSVSALAFTLLSRHFPHCTYFLWGGVFFHWAAIVLMLVLGVPALLRIILFPHEVRQTISHPIEGSFYASFPISLLVLAGEWTVRGLPQVAVAGVWWTGTAFIWVVSYMVLFALFSTEKLSLDNVTPGHFMPAVGLVVIPVAGSGMAAMAQGGMREVYFGLNMVAFGAGVFMYVGLLALTMTRHFIASPIEGKFTPTLWVHMAPLGVIPLSMLSLLHAAGDNTAINYATMAAAAFLGAGLWWLVLCLALTVKNIRNGKLPFALSWWAFLFPVGAITSLSMRLSELMQLELLPYVAAALSLLLCCIWGVVMLGTLRGLCKGTIIPPRQAPASQAAQTK